jgi:LmbE family N-acetylglucosaminyl deacetylase
MDINDKTSIFIPDGTDLNKALQRTTMLCIAAHQDDTEIMAYNAIAEAYGEPDKWFTSVIVTDGGGSPRDGIYANYTDVEMKAVRVLEQNAAAVVGNYSAQIQLGYNSAAVKTQANDALKTDLMNIISKCRPQIVYTHNLADKHDTHVAVALHTLRAIRELPDDIRPEKLYGMEVWRSLDWLPDKDKAVFDASGHENLSSALLGVFDSQICGGKRYDLAALGRRRANATFLADHAVDKMNAATYGIDMTELLVNPGFSPEEFIIKYVEMFKADISERISRLWDKC